MAEGHTDNDTFRKISAFNDKGGGGKSQKGILADMSVIHHSKVKWVTIVEPGWDYIVSDYYAMHSYLSQQGTSIQCISFLSI